MQLHCVLHQPLRPAQGNSNLWELDSLRLWSTEEELEEYSFAVAAVLFASLRDARGKGAMSGFQSWLLFIIHHTAGKQKDRKLAEYMR